MVIVPKGKQKPCQVRLRCRKQFICCSLLIAATDFLYLCWRPSAGGRSLLRPTCWYRRRSTLLAAEGSRSLPCFSFCSVRAQSVSRDLMYDFAAVAGKLVLVTAVEGLRCYRCVLRWILDLRETEPGQRFDVTPRRRLGRNDTTSNVFGIITQPNVDFPRGCETLYQILVFSKSLKHVVWRLYVSNDPRKAVNEETSRRCLTIS